MSNLTNVVLRVVPTGVAAASILAVNNVRDATPLGNIVPTNSSAVVGVNISVPIDSVWKYEDTGTDLGTTWKNIAYPDTSWPNGAALLYNETSTLPAPKNTPLPLYTSNNNIYITTFYFRQHVPLAVGVTNPAFVFRHVIDDGAVLYFNGSEFHRFNMPTSQVTYQTLANVFVPDASYSGPYTANIASFIGGDNVLAAEVHQNGLTSSDITFGAEFNIMAPSILLPVVIPPRLSVRSVSGGLQISWQGNGYTLQSATELRGAATVWTSVSNQTNPNFQTTPTNAQFFRLKH
jgi:hypothetical protein